MKHITARATLCAVGIAMVVIPLWPQTQSPQKPSFEVVSVKPNVSGEPPAAIAGLPGGRIVATNVSLMMLMDSAYRVRDFQILGGPNWISSDRWNIEAKAEEGSISPPVAAADSTVFSPLSLMLQSLIEDRFQLKMHRENRELPVYELLMAKDGPKFKPSEDQGPIRPEERIAASQRGGPIPRGSMRAASGDVQANGVPIAVFTATLAQQLGRPVIDKTDLKGLYDLKLQWMPTSAATAAFNSALADASKPSIFTAIQEQLGLRLESAKGSVEVLVIDSVQKPSED